ncbi:class I SAM-dependent methyltransferase [Oleiharenicola lentus]|uniref:class I SAM-dependent methyltransferase n=1 Tax=Oleiharenicola lentus TaxID=2508720 RepID=UPI003F681D02
MKPLYDFSSLHVNRAIAARDGMVAPEAPEQYFDLGKRALELIKFSAELCDKPHYPDILDLPCGHGRVLRWLRAYYDYANITACDLDRDGVDFCATQFRATPFYSDVDLRRLPFESKFDLIWVGSLLTHLREDRWLTALDCLINWVRECGVIIFTTQGRTASSLLARGQKNVAENIDKSALLADYARHGFAYQRYFESTPEADYGFALSSPEWVLRQLQRYPNTFIRAYLEDCWGIQDVVILYKKAGQFEPLLGNGGVTATAQSPAAKSPGLLKKILGR